MITKFEEVKIVARKRVVWLVVEIVLVIGLLSLSGCGAAWISYSKESQAKQSALQIQRQQEEIGRLNSDLELAQIKIGDQRQRIVDLIGEKNDLVDEKDDLFDQLKKKSYKITLKVDGAYKTYGAGASEVESESQVQETISEFNKTGKEVGESADSLKEEFGDKKKDKDKPEKKADK